MTVNELLILVRQRLGDMQKILFSDEELIYCLNNAIDKLSLELSVKHDPNIVKTIVINNTEKVKKPEDFIGLCGQFPLEWDQQDFENIYLKHSNPAYDGKLVVRYYARRPNVKTLEDKVPFLELAMQKHLMDLTVQEIKPSGTDGGEEK